ncbi:lysophospholipid acyltransferase family protein [Paenibacillus sp. BIHB 4019]|uniref:lysophospholipid acyltransferase family protein n=1 Tax=Paenibacillus sp. BIHB 4019 TaxID=1870819 RepID=UPI000C14537F|nr:lysophospholipid acyltransferase family protein [Paenibacillus sp. BIHB 4019]
MLKRHFHAVSMRGELDQVPADRPLLLIMNHSCWWDGLLVYHMIRSESQRRHYMMMDERQMKRYAFFRRIGAFSVNKENLREMAASLRYAAGLLRSGGAVWLFPQGDIFHLESRPLQFQTGIGYLLERCPDAAVLPVSLYYTMGLHQKASATFSIGSRIEDDWRALGRKEAAMLLERKLEEQLDEHRLAVIAGADGERDGFRPLLATGRSVNETFDQMKGRAARWKSFFGR